MEVNQMEVNQMEVKKELSNSKIESQTEFNELLKISNLSLQEYIDLYDLVYTIAYPVNFRRKNIQVSTSVQEIALRIPCCLHPSIYKLMLISIDNCMSDHPDFIQDDDDISF